VQLAAAFALLAVSACSRGADDAASAARLPKLPIDPATVTVSGISSGGAMAVQFHVAHSALVRGTGILAGIPYLCAEESPLAAISRCMKAEEEIPASQLIARTRRLAEEGAIDPVAGLAGDRVWIFHGAADPYVRTPVVDAIEAQYRALATPGNIVRIEHPEAGHAFPVADPEAPACGAFEKPYVSNCGLDGARALLEHVYGPLASGTAPRPDGLTDFDQRPYASAVNSKALATRGWMYVPAACNGAAAGACRLHIVLHGCRQGASFVADGFVRRSGYLPLAEANRIVLLFPQVEPSTMPLNPMGCWDWWGYEGADFATRNGRQIRALRAMVADLLGEARTAP
jgi:poly(3-hydroxybutyrate) depolymerase